MSRIRITGGEWRSRLIKVNASVKTLRPTPDRVRVTLFNWLGQDLTGLFCLDLFAGSGAYGLEALSRGAAGGVFVEQNAKAAACVRRNIEAVCKSLGPEARDLSVLQTDARGVPLGNGGVPDLVFIDPPYEIIAEITPALFSRLAEALASKPEAIVVFESPGEIELAPPGWTLLKRLGKGSRQPTVTFFRRADATPSPA